MQKGRREAQPRAAELPVCTRALAHALAELADAPEVDRDPAHGGAGLDQQALLQVDVEAHAAAVDRGEVGHVGDRRRLGGDPVGHPPMDPLPLQELHRQLLLADQDHRRARGLVDVAHDLDHLAGDQVVGFVDQQRPARARQPLGDLVDHVGDGLRRLDAQVLQHRRAELLPGPAALHLDLVGPVGVGRVDRGGGLAVARGAVGGGEGRRLTVDGPLFHLVNVQALLLGANGGRELRLQLGGVQLPEGLLPGLGGDGGGDGRGNVVA